MTARLLVVQHESTCPSGLFGESVLEAGLDLDVAHAYAGEGVPDTLDAYEGLVVLGGAMGANDDASYGWLAPTRTLISRAAADDRPILGICLGHQLVAVALGGAISANPLGRTRGLIPIGLGPEGAADLLLSTVPDDAVAVHWNNDIVTRLPDGAVPLAHDPAGAVQAVRYGTRAWGIQWHPEVTAEIFRAWMADESLNPTNDPEGAALAGRIAVSEGVLRATWWPFFTRFAQLVADPVPR